MIIDTTISPYQEVKEILEDWVKVLKAQGISEIQVKALERDITRFVGVMEESADKTAKLRQENQALKNERDHIINQVRGSCVMCKATDAREVFPGEFVCPHMDGRFINAFCRPPKKTCECDKWELMGDES